MRTFFDFDNNPIRDGQSIAMCEVILPDTYVYLKDANFMTLRFQFDNNIYNPVKRIAGTVEIDTNNGVYTYTATTYNNVLMFNINNMFSEAFKMTTDSDPEEEQSNVAFNSIRLSATINGQNSGVATFNTIETFQTFFSIFDGYSLPNRSHGTDTAVFVPDIDGERDYINMIATTDVGMTSIQHEGFLIPFYAPKEGCKSETTVVQMTNDVRWLNDDHRDWTFGIESVVIDRVIFHNDLVNLQKDLETAGFNTTLLPTYNPVSVWLRATQDEGVWECWFFTNVDDGNGGRELIWYIDDWYVKEHDEQSLFSFEWYSKRAFDSYYSTDVVPTLTLSLYHRPNNVVEDGITRYNIDATTQIDCEMELIVKYDSVMTSSETFSETPLTAIRFYTDPYVDSPSGFKTDGYNYVVHCEDGPYGYFANMGDFDMYVRYWMFGNHLAYSTDKSSEINQLITNPSLIPFYSTVEELGMGVAQMMSDESDHYFWEDIGNNDAGWFTFDINNHNRDFLTYNTLWDHLWEFFNSTIMIRRTNITKWSFSTYQHWNVNVLQQPHRWTIKTRDFCASLPEWTKGVPIIEYFNTKNNVTIPHTGGDITIDTAYDAPVRFYPARGFAKNRAQYISNMLPLHDDNGHYYDYYGDAAADVRGCHFFQLQINFETDNDLLNWNFYFQQNMYLVSGTNVTITIPDIPHGGAPNPLVGNSTTTSGNRFGTYAGFNYLPYTCGVPFIKLNDQNSASENIRTAQFSRLTYVYSQPTDPDDTNQIVQNDMYYDTPKNVGRDLQVLGTAFYEEAPQTRNMCVDYPDYDQTLYPNTEDYTQFFFDTIDALYDATNYFQSIHIEGFNTHSDFSYLITNGCIDSQTQTGDIISGDQSVFTIYTFSMCDAQRVVWIKYKNMDGLWRYLPAEVVEQTYTNQRQDLQKVSPQYFPFNSVPKWSPYSLEEKIAVYISNIPAEMHIEDMLYSTSLQIINNNWKVDVALEEDSITRTLDGGENFVLHFIKKQ